MGLHHPIISPGGPASVISDLSLAHRYPSSFGSDNARASARRLGETFALMDSDRFSNANQSYFSWRASFDVYASMKIEVQIHVKCKQVASSISRDSSAGSTPTSRPVSSPRY